MFRVERAAQKLSSEFYLTWLIQNGTEEEIERIHEIVLESHAVYYIEDINGLEFVRRY
jgi:hypothetical protein|tara:strand:+ start:195 stop:368 length:174 start_codon:yes stop_codon:yes gene_type:complete